MSQQNQPEMLSGGAMLVRALHDEGVEYVYGYPAAPCYISMMRCFSKMM